MAISTFLDWGPNFGLDFSSVSLTGDADGIVRGIGTGFLGLFGILTLVIGLVLVAVGAIRAFSPSTSLPDEIAGFSLTQVCLVLAFSVFFWTFALISEEIEFGVHLAWIGALIAAVGAVLELRSTTSASAGGAGPINI